MQNPLPVAPALLNAFTQGLLSQRQWMHDNFPESESILAIDILVNVANNTLSNNPTPMKDLLGSIPFSEVGIRKQVTRLKKTGWLRIDRSALDQRIRVLVAEDKLLAMLQRYAAQCAPIKSAA